MMPSAFSNYKKEILARNVHFSSRYINAIFPFNNTDIDDYLSIMYSPELEIKDKSDIDSSVSYLGLCPKCDNMGKLKTRLYDQRDFHIVNVPQSLVYGVMFNN